jgi:acetylornithine aminotransferase
VRAPYNDIASIEAIAENNRNVVAVLVEPVQGEAGIVIPDPGYLAALRRICDDNGWLLMLDEIQTGMARSGKMFACEHEAVVPDVMTLAKALANGVPIGACLTRGVAADVFRPGNHGSTFGGNPLACRAGYTVLSSMLDAGIAANAATRGEQLAAALRTGLADIPAVDGVRHLGMLVAVQMRNPCQQLVPIALEHGLLVNVTAESVIRLLPPLILDEAETADIAAILIDCIHQITG